MTLRFIQSGANQADTGPGNIVAFPQSSTSPPGPPAALAEALPPQATPCWLHLSPPQLAGSEYAALCATLDSGWIAPAGPVPRAFEAALGRATGFEHVAAVSSGTAALHLGYRVLDVAAGDGVWTSSFTFVATVAPAVQMGAVATFLDVCPDSWTLDPELLRTELARAARVGKLPRVVVPVDVYGQCCDLDTIVAICDRWGVAVMSDSAEALGATQRGRAAGQGAQLAAFSFNGNKIITAGGGGALASDDERLVARARFLASQAREAGAHYQHDTIGYSYGLSSVLAAVGMAQLLHLEERVTQRRAVFARYLAGLGDLPGVSFMPEPAWGRSSRWLSTVLFDPAVFGADREAVRRALHAAGIESRPLWKPLHLQPAFRGAGFVGPGVAAGLFERGLCLPSGAMSVSEQERVIEVVRGCARA
ncbi:DegT/DnrJ/EryC1/StrS family aminotransferase [Roseomonas sp. BN140053]|uniref:DegT/DnrJ/EryC1/StrS family aminotransferase n=1 Tax=Roseomonas sp. BN140053 TaxID=3391898 RepID=UPI0039ED5486